MVDVDTANISAHRLEGHDDADEPRKRWDDVPALLAQCDQLLISSHDLSDCAFGEAVPRPGAHGRLRSPEGLHEGSLRACRQRAVMRRELRDVSPEFLGHADTQADARAIAVGCARAARVHPYHRRVTGDLGDD